ncbi:hypothetical protein [Streptomyces sp. NPDC087300]|uniref:hypothetical protein n=1 Tax=Streptomyces sp. NPDC087300 TaxID=3365780 RepID=UPI0037FF89B4
MSRTEQERTRRRDIVDAANGIRAARAVIYDNVHGMTLAESTDLGGAVLEYAHARDWAVAEVLTDDCPLDTPRDERPAWSMVATLVEDPDAAVTLIVCSNLDHIAPAADLPALYNWLDTLVAHVHVPEYLPGLTERTAS